MISSITIKNYKSVVDVKLPMGRFNLLIGENGCGKSNILEGIAMGAAASSDKLNYEYFANRGMRIVEPRFMLPAFDEIEANSITIGVMDEWEKESTFNIFYNKEARPAHWEVDSVNIEFVLKYFKDIISDYKNDELTKKIAELNNIIEEAKKNISANIRIKNFHKENSEFMPTSLDWEHFLIYSLEESKLREADNSNRIFPLGRHGEGLFAYLKDLAQKPKSINIFQELKENLRILDWFDDLQIPSEQLSMEFNLKLKDSYLSDTLNMFDQRSTNEGFLYLLFYFTLVISDETPRFFAIENIDTAFNPKLCKEIIKRLVSLAKKYNKQIIATTHNPAILDGLDLRNDEQKLMVVQRSIDGYTKVRTLKKEEVINSELSLSQLWQRGFIGGLPNNF